MQWTDVALMRLPVLAERFYQVQLIAQVQQQTVVPLLRHLRLPDAGQVQFGHGDPFLPKPRHGAHFKAGLADLTGIQNVAELAASQALEEVGISLAWDVGGSILGQISSGNIEALLCYGHRLFSP